MPRSLIGDALHESWVHWRAKYPYRIVNGKMTDQPSNPGDYMMATYPGRYKDRNSARRTYNKIYTGESSGRNLSLYNTRKYKTPLYMKRGTPGGRAASGAIHGEIGTTVRVTVFFYDSPEALQEAVDTAGESNHPFDTRSFIADTQTKMTRDDYPYYTGLINNAAEQKISEWEEHYPITDYRLIEWTIIPITYTTNITHLDYYNLSDEFGYNDDYTESE